MKTIEEKETLKEVIELLIDLKNELQELKNDLKKESSNYQILLEKKG